MRTAWLTSKLGGAVAGSVIELEEGTYSGEFTINASGTSTQPIIIRPARRGARVVIDGGLTINGNYVYLQDVEIKYSGWTSRISAFSDPSPADIPLSKSFTVNGSNCRVFRCTLHDLATVGAFGVAGWWRWNHIYGIGWDAPDRGHGHGIYAQNTGAESIFEYNIIHDCYGWSFHAYSQTAGQLNNITARYNILFNAASPAFAGANNLLIGGVNVVATNAKAQNNDTYGATGAGINIGYDDTLGGATGAYVTDNYAPDGLQLHNVTAVDTSGNVTSPPGSGIRTVVRADSDVYGHGSVSIYNWDSVASVNVNVSAILPAGAACHVHYAQNYDSDVVDAVVAGDGTLTFNVQASAHSVLPTIAGATGALTAPTYACFILEI